MGCIGAAGTALSGRPEPASTAAPLGLPIVRRRALAPLSGTLSGRWRPFRAKVGEYRATGSRNSGSRRTVTDAGTDPKAVRSSFAANGRHDAAMSIRSPQGSRFQSPGTFP